MNEAATGINNTLKNVVVLISRILDELRSKILNKEYKTCLKVVYGKEKGCILLRSL